MPAVNSKSEITTESCLLIFDPHQNIQWCKNIIAKERGRISHLLLGGDYFDTFDRALPCADAMCDYLLELEQEFFGHVTILLGNHDIPYVESARMLRDTGAVGRPNHWCSGYNEEAARVIATRLGEKFWSQCRLFQVTNGWLATHAGVAGRHWPTTKTPAAALRKFEARCQRALAEAQEKPSELLGAGFARFGMWPVGGLTWLDFSDEFADDPRIPFPQVCGHTTSRSGARQNGRAWCLDGHQSCYGVLHANGKLEVVDRP